MFQSPERSKSPPVVENGLDSSPAHVAGGLAMVPEAASPVVVNGTDAVPEIPTTPSKLPTAINGHHVEGEASLSPSPLSSSDGNSPRTVSPRSDLSSTPSSPTSPTTRGTDGTKKTRKKGFVLHGLKLKGSFRKSKKDKYDVEKNVGPTPVIGDPSPPAGITNGHLEGEGISKPGADIHINGVDGDVTVSAALDDKSPKISAQSPTISAQTPEVSAPTPTVSVQTPDVSAHIPEISAQTPEISAQTPDVRVQVPPVAINGELPTVNGGLNGTADTNVTVGISDTSTPAKPNIDIDSPNDLPPSPIDVTVNVATNGDTSQDLSLGNLGKSVEVEPLKDLALESTVQVEANGNLDPQVPDVKADIPDIKQDVPTVTSDVEVAKVSDIDVHIQQDSPRVDSPASTTVTITSPETPSLDTPAKVNTDVKKPGIPSVPALITTAPTPEQSSSSSSVNRPQPKFNMPQLETEGDVSLTAPNFDVTSDDDDDDTKGGMKLSLSADGKTRDANHNAEIEGSLAVPGDKEVIILKQRK